MTHLQAIRARLALDSATVALVSDRIYPQVVKQGATAPFIVITTVSDVIQNSMTGSPATRLRIARVQVDCYAVTYIGAHAVAEAAFNVVGALGEVELNAFLDTAQDLYDNETSLHRVSMDFQVAL